MGCSEDTPTKPNTSTANKKSNSPSSNSKWKIIFVLGEPGGGKNTQCDLIEEKYQIIHFSCGDLLRDAVKENVPEAEEINNYMKEGKIVPAEVTCGLQKKFMIKNGSNYKFYLCDGFPRNEENLKGFQKTFGDEIEICGVLYIKCDEEVCLQRIKARAEASTEKRIDDNVETIRKRFKVMREETLPNLENFRKFTNVWMIDSNKTKEEVFKQIDDVLKDVLEPRTTPLNK
jgi:adenylate kinase family enzyme